MQRNWTKWLVGLTFVAALLMVGLTLVASGSMDARVV